MQYLGLPLQRQGWHKRVPTFPISVAPAASVLASCKTMKPSAYSIESSISALETVAAIYPEGRSRVDAGVRFQHHVTRIMRVTGDKEN